MNAHAEAIEKKICDPKAMLLDQTVFEFITIKSPRGDMLSVIFSARGQIQCQDQEQTR